MVPHGGQVRLWSAVRSALVLTSLLAACGSSSPATHDAAVDAVDAAPLPDGKASACASTFGSALTNAFGRLDGTILAVVEPGNMACAMPNSTHVIIEVTANGAAYRMVANVLSTSSDPHVWLDEIDAPLAGVPWAEGWHPGIALDYVTTLQVSKTAFTQADQAAAVARFETELVPVRGCRCTRPAPVATARTSSTATRRTRTARSCSPPTPRRTTC